MIHPGTLFLIYQLLYTISRIQANNNDSQETYTSEKFKEDLASLKASSEEKVGDQYAKIVNSLLRTDVKAIFGKLETDDDVSDFLIKCLKEVMLVYETAEYGLYFSSKRENSTEPEEGLTVYVRENDKSAVKNLLELFGNVYLTVYIRVMVINLGKSLKETWDLRFITGLCVEYHNSDISSQTPSFSQIIFVSELAKLHKLETVKLINILVDETILDNLSRNRQMKNLNFWKCYFYSREDISRNRDLDGVNFSESYESICFEMCGKNMQHKKFKDDHPSYITCLSIDVTKCTNLRQLHINSPGYLYTKMANKDFRNLRDFSFFIQCKEKKCQTRFFSVPLEYFAVIIIKEEGHAFWYLGAIEKSKLRHLCITYSVKDQNLDIAEIFRLEFVSLEILEIKSRNGLSFRFCTMVSDIEANMKKLKSLIIVCKQIEKTGFQAMNNLRSLTDLHMKLPFDKVGIYNDFKDQFKLKESINTLSIDSFIQVEKLGELLAPFKNLTNLRTQNVFQPHSKTKDSVHDPANNNMGPSINLMPSLLNSQDIKCPSVTTLHLLVNFWNKTDFPGSVYECKAFFIFPNVKEIILESYYPDPNCKTLPKNTSNSQLEPNVKPVAKFISTVFKKFKFIKTLVIDTENENLIRKLVDEFCEMSSRNKKRIVFPRRYKWSKKYKAQRIIWNIRK